MRLTKKGFKEWLEGKDPSEIAGISVNSTSCPLAVYLQNETGHLWEVERDHYHDAITSHDLPRWAQQFVVNVDDFTLGEPGKVSARDSLELL